MATFQEYHGISLAANSWIENLVVEQLVSDPVPVGPGRVWFNTTDKKFKQSTLDATGGVIIRVFATEEALSTSVAALQAEIDSVADDLAAETARATAAEGVLTTDLAAEVTARAAADSALSARIDALGNAFNYVGALVGGATEAEANDLATLPADGKNSGDYYKVTTAGYFKVGTGSVFYANINDGLVWNTFGGVDKIDNTDSTVSGTTDFIAVTGSADTGFVVDVDSVFKGRVSTLESGLAAEVSNRTAADATLQAAINAEVTARQATDSALAAEVSRATGVEGSLASLTTTAKSNLVAAINELDTDLASEAAARQAADGDLETLVTTDKSSLVAAINELSDELVTVANEEASARNAADDALRADIAAEVTNRQAADTALQTAINTEVSTRAAADTAINADISELYKGISNEMSAREAADATLTTNLAAEVTAREAAVSAEASARTSADAALQAAIDAEATARISGDAAINSSIGSLATLTTTEKGTIVGAINEVKALAGNGVSSLVTQLNSYRYTETTTTAATSHTISHGLGSTLVDVCVWIDRGDGIWRNDMAAVSIVDSTSVKVDLTAARNIRITVEKMAAFV